MEVRSSQADPVFWWSTPLLAAAFPSLEGSVCTRSQQSQLALLKLDSSSNHITHEGISQPYSS